MRLKQIIPQLETVYFRQDNAGCYHTSNTSLYVKSKAATSGVNVRVIAFSDPQGGKAASDKQAASLKRSISIYSNEGHAAMWKMQDK